MARKFTVFALFYFVFEGYFQGQARRGAGGLCLEGKFNGEFFCVTRLGGLYLEGLIHGGAYFRTSTVLTISLRVLRGNGGSHLRPSSNTGSIKLPRGQVG